MLKRIGIVFLRILLISLVLFASYYFFFLKPKAELQKNKDETVKILSLYKNALTQNRLSYISLTKLDPTSPNINLEKSYAINKLKTTQTDISIYVDIYNSIPNIDAEVTNRFPTLISETASVVTRQKNILQMVYDKSSYEEGVAILKSDDSIKLLTDETNLILECQWWIEKIGDIK